MIFWGKKKKGLKQTHTTRTCIRAKKVKRGHRNREWPEAKNLDNSQKGMNRFECLAKPKNAKNP